MNGSPTRILTATLTEPVFIPRPVDVTDENAFPAIAEAQRWYASLSDERRAELENDYV